MSKQAKEQSALPSQERESLTNRVQETETTKVSRNSSSEKPAAVKMTLYISKGTAKEFKKLAIDEELDYSQLAERAFIEFVQKHSAYAS